MNRVVKVNFGCTLGPKAPNIKNPLFPLSFDLAFSNERSRIPTTLNQGRGSPRKALFPETDLHRGIVGWDGQDDPAKPQNFSSPRKWGLLMNSMFVTSALISSIFAPPASFMAAEFGVSNRSLIALLLVFIRWAIR